MKTQPKVYLSFLLLFLISVGNYLLFFNTSTWKDEAVLVSFIGALVLVYYILIRKHFHIHKELSSIKSNALSAGIVKEEMQQAMSDLEIVKNTVDKLITSVQKANLFIIDIKSGNLHVNTHEAGIDENDFLMNSLHDLRNQMLEIEQEEKERNWVSQGMSRFVDILRGSDHGLEDFYFGIITNIVKYLEANQGSLFLVQEKNGKHFLSMEACYAYNRRKFIKKEIEAGEGLVGQVYLEKETTYLKEIPQNYITITSGLGEAIPRNLLLVPFKLNEEVQCIIEIASFHEIKKYQIDFLEKLGESVASAISSFRINENTKILLEETQTQTETLRAQEEEMRQNMEELQATQESLERQSKEKEQGQKEIQKTMDFMQSVINALPDPVFVKDRDHRVVLVNEACCQLNKIKAEDIIGKNDYDMFPKEEADIFFAEEEKLFLERKSALYEEKATRDGEVSFRKTKKIIIEDDDGKLFLVGMNSDITDSKELEEALKKEKYLLDALMNNSTDNIYFKDKESKFIRVSENMLKLFNVDAQKDVVGKSDFDFFAQEHAQPAYDGEQEIIRTGKPILNLVEKETFDNGKFSYVSTTKIALKDLEGNIIGTFGISRDVTEAKINEINIGNKERLMRSLFNYSFEILLILSNKREVSFVSSNADKIINLDHLKMVGQQISTFLHRDDIPKLEQALKTLSVDDELVLKLRIKTGEEKYIQIESYIYNALENEDINGYVFKMTTIGQGVLA